MARIVATGWGVALRLSDKASANPALGAGWATEGPPSAREALSPVESEGARECSRARKTSASSDAGFFGSRARSSIRFHALMYGCELRVVTERTRIAAERMS